MYDCLLIGGSVRAAAWSARRAGLRPLCLDLFADSDLRLLADCQRIAVDDYPARLPDLLLEAPPGPVVYTGGLENHPTVIERIARQRPVWGNDAAALRQIRDPFRIRDWLWTEDLPALMISQVPLSVPSLRKPLRGSGGQHIRATQGSDTAVAGYCFQEFRDGLPCAAIFNALPEATMLLGITRQLVGTDWLNARPFHYAGSVGPIDIGDTARAILCRLADVLHRRCGLRGLFGIDFILADDVPWLVEVNPRYTASVEVLERSLGIAALAQHCQAFTGVAVDESGGSPPYRVHGKAILFAPRMLTVPTDAWPDRECLADIPHSGETIEAGWPIVTVLADSSSAEECIEQLRQRTRQLKEAL